MVVTPSRASSHPKPKSVSTNPAAAPATASWGKCHVKGRLLATQYLLQIHNHKQRWLCVWCGETHDLHASHAGTLQGPSQAAPAQEKQAARDTSACPRLTSDPEVHSASQPSPPGARAVLSEDDLPFSRTCLICSPQVHKQAASAPCAGFCFDRPCTSAGSHRRWASPHMCGHASPASLRSTVRSASTPWACCCSNKRCRSGSSACTALMTPSEGA